MDSFLVENRIRDFRLKMHLPQWKMALATSISESRMCLLEQGAPPRLNEKRRLVSFLGVGLQEIWPQERPGNETSGDD